MIKTKKSIARFLGEPKPLKNTIKNGEAGKAKQRLNQNKAAGDDEKLTELLKYRLEALLKKISNKLDAVIEEYNIAFGLLVLPLMQKQKKKKVLHQDLKIQITGLHIDMSSAFNTINGKELMKILVM